MHRPYQVFAWREDGRQREFRPVSPYRWVATRQGLTLAHFRAQLEDLPEHIAHVRAHLEHLRDASRGLFGSYGGQSKLKLSGSGQSKFKFSRNGNECKPLPPVRSCRCQSVLIGGCAGGLLSTSKPPPPLCASGSLPSTPWPPPPAPRPPPSLIGASSSGAMLRIGPGSGATVPPCTD
jgi:hypothetical protein